MTCGYFSPLFHVRTCIEFFDCCYMLNTQHYRKATEHVGGSVMLDCPSDFFGMETFSETIRWHLKVLFFLQKKSIQALLLIWQHHCVAATLLRHCPGIATSREVTGELKQVQVTWNANFCLMHNLLASYGKAWYIKWNRHKYTDGSSLQRRQHGVKWHRNLLFISGTLHDFCMWTAGRNTA